MSSLTDFALQTLPRFSADENRFEGTLKSIPSDFVVEEIPAYLPSGEGEHIFLLVEKEGISAEQLQMHLSKTLEISRNELGIAGLKDRHAITRQWVSVPFRCEHKFKEVESEFIRVLEVSRHQNKLKTGHLKGNDFKIVVRDSPKNSFARSVAVQESILAKGVPNFFGSQRFGRDAETVRVGEQLLRGEIEPQSIPKQRRKFLTRMGLSAVQSALFNAVLKERMERSTTHTVLMGDVLQVTASGGPFVCTEAEVDQLRFDKREVVTSGPIFGPKMKSPFDEAGELESTVLKQFDLTPEHFTRFKKLTPGARRPLILWLDELSVEEVNEGIQFQFSLPSGAYATTVMREFLIDE